MRQGRAIRIAIIAANLALAIVCLAAYAREDKARPEFMFQTGDFVYYLESGEIDALLQGVMAHDDRDGDITDRIVIEKMTENRDSSTVVVYYAVSDSAGNVAKASRAFPAVFDGPSHEEAAQAFSGAGTPDVGTLENPGGQDGSIKDADGQTDSEDGGENEDGEDSSREGESSGQEDEGGAPGEDSEEGPDDGRREEDRQQEEDAVGGRQEPADEAENRRDETADAGEGVREQQEPAGSGAPVLALKKTEVTIEAGTAPPWTEIIETLRDDKDDYATLYYNLNISRFNRNQPGDYPVTLYTEDSDGNRSGTATVIVHVKGNGN